MFQFALAISALIGTMILGFASFQILFWLSLIPQVIGLGIGFALIEPRVHDTRQETNIFSHLKEAIMRFRTNMRLRKLSR